MPLSVAAVEGRRVEVEFVLPRPGKPDCLLQWSASPLKDAEQGHAVVAKGGAGKVLLVVDHD